MPAFTRRTPLHAVLLMALVLLSPLSADSSVESSASEEAALAPSEVADVIRRALANAPKPTASAEEERTGEGEGGVTDEGGMWAKSAAGRIELAPVGQGKTPLRSAKVDDLLVSGGFAVRKTNEGAQGFAVLSGARSAMPVWRLQLPEGVKPSIDEETGRVRFLKTEEKNVLALDVALEKPWAVDATGKRLSTRYELDGDKVVQHVDLKGAEFPVVTDPRLTYGWGVYLNMFGAELATIGALAVGVGKGGWTALCATSKLPSGLARFTTWLCVTVGSSTVSDVYEAMADVYKSVDNSACYQAQIVPQSKKFKKTKFKNCVPD
jgi:hypothetical protein